MPTQADWDKYIAEQFGGTYPGGPSQTEIGNELIRQYPEQADRIRAYQGGRWMQQDPQVAAQAPPGFAREAVLGPTAYLQGLPTFPMLGMGAATQLSRGEMPTAAWAGRMQSQLAPWASHYTPQGPWEQAYASTMYGAGLGTGAVLAEGAPSVVPWAAGTMLGRYGAPFTRLSAAMRPTAGTLGVSTATGALTGLEREQMEAHPELFDPSNPLRPLAVGTATGLAVPLTGAVVGAGTRWLGRTMYPPPVIDHEAEFNKLADRLYPGASPKGGVPMLKDAGADVQTQLNRNIARATARGDPAGKGGVIGTDFDQDTVDAINKSAGGVHRVIFDDDNPDFAQILRDEMPRQMDALVAGKMGYGAKEIPGFPVQTKRAMFPDPADEAKIVNKLTPPKDPGLAEEQIRIERGVGRGVLSEAAGEMARTALGGVPVVGPLFETAVRMLPFTAKTALARMIPRMITTTGTGVGVMENPLHPLQSYPPPQ